MSREFSQADLEAYLDEALAASEMAQVEAALREQPDLIVRLQAIHGRRDAGLHTLGEVWRRHRVSCPDRETLGSFLLNVLDVEHQGYVEFHLQQVGCRICQANLDDLQSRQAEVSAAARRQTRYFQSSAGYLKK